MPRSYETTVNIAAEIVYVLPYDLSLSMLPGALTPQNQKQRREKMWSEVVVDEVS